MGLMDSFMRGQAAGSTNPLMQRFMNPMTQWGLAQLTQSNPNAAVANAINWQSQNTPAVTTPLELLKMQDLQSKMRQRQVQMETEAAQTQALEGYSSSVAPSLRAQVAAGKTLSSDQKAWNTYWQQATAAGETPEPFESWIKSYREAGGIDITTGGERSPIDKMYADLQDALAAGDTARANTIQKQIDKATQSTAETLEQQRENKLKAARTTVESLESMIDEIYKGVGEDTIGERIAFAINANLQQFTQDDPVFKVYSDLSKGAVGNLIRSLGESGALAEGDVERAIALLPITTGINPDKPSVARRKMKELRKLLGMDERGDTGTPGVSSTSPLEEDYDDAAWKRMMDGLEEVPD